MRKKILEYPQHTFLAVVIVASSFLMFAVFSAGAQQVKSEKEDDEISYPKVGEQIEDHVFTELENYAASSAKVSDFRGKWLILDFWGWACGSCINSFPKMDKLAKEFKDQIQLIMVGSYQPKFKDSYRKTKEVFRLRKNDLGLSFTVAYDSLVDRKYDIYSVPYILVVDPNGKIVAKTSAVSREQLKELIAGKEVPFAKAFSGHEKLEYNTALPLLTTGNLANGGVDTGFAFRSILVKHNNKIALLRPRPLTHPQSEAVKSGVYEISRIGLSGLYKAAYFGASSILFGGKDYEQQSEQLELNIKDKSPFVENKANLSGLWAYSLKLPTSKSSASEIMTAMQSDLKRFFGYNVNVEKRKKLVHKLIIIDTLLARALATKGGKPSYKSEEGMEIKGYGVINKRLFDFTQALLKCIPPESVLLDRTGITFNVDIYIKANMMSLTAVNDALEKVGLCIKPDEEEMDVIVVRDE
ncbi:TlpA family protein disulfide reductase [Pedobacter chitinilyticus]|nr:TlpA disulfide reductase family protein [Pedobacter chitinilyticus]